MGPIPSSSGFCFSGFLLDIDRRTLTCGEELIPLTPKEFLTLRLLVEASGHAVSREKLMDTLWPDAVVGDTSLARNVSALRRHLGPDSIKVVPKFGYRFTLPITIPAPEPAEPTLAPHLPASPPTPSPRPPSGPVAAPLSGVPDAGRRFSPFSFWISLAALIVAAVFLSVRLVSARRQPITPLTWTDPQTHLMWMTTDNGHDVTRQQALDFCANLNYAGYRDWQLPQIDELQTLYDTSVSVAGIWGPTRPVYWHVKGNLHLTGGTAASNVTWLTDQTPAGLEQSYDFSFGRRNYDPTSFSADHRALCMRHSTNQPR